MKKYLIIISIVLVGLLAAVEAYVQSDGFGDRIRPFVVGPLKASLGEGISIGRMKANFIPLFLELRDISLPDDTGKQIVAIHKIRIYINPLPLLLKKIRLSHISILDPRVALSREADGAVNLTPLVERIRSNITGTTSGGLPGFKVLLRSITVKNGQLTFTDNVTSGRLSVIGVNMTVRVDLSQERAKVVLRGSEVHGSAPAYPEFAGRFKTTLEYNRGSLRIDSAELMTADASLTVTGALGLLPDAPLDLKVQLKSGPKAIRRFADFLKPVRKQEASRMEATALIRGTISDPVIDGGIKVASVSFYGMLLREAALSFAYRNSAVSIKGEKWTLMKGETAIVIDDIDAAIGYRRGGIEVSRFLVRADDLLVRLEGGTDPATGLDVRLSAESSGGGKTLSFLTALPIEGAVGVEGRISGAMTSPRFDGELSAGPVTVRGIPFSQVRGGMEFSGNKLTLSSVDIHEGSSRYVFDGAADFSGKETFFTARLRVTRSDVVNIVALFYRHLPLRLSAEGELSFAGTARNYTGSGYLMLASGSAYGETFTRGTITAKLSTGRIAFPQVVVYKERGMVKGSGWIGFDRTYSADVESRDVDLSAVDYLSGLPFGGTFALDVHSSGSFTLPYVNVSLELDELLYRRVPVGGMNAEGEIKDGLFVINAELSGERGDLAIKWNLLKPYTWTADARVKSDAIDPFLLVGNSGLAGKMKMVADGTASVQGKGMDISSLSGEAVFQKLGLIIGDFRMDNEANAGFSLDAGRVTATALNFTGPGTRLTVTGGTKLFSDIDLTLKGTLNLSLLKLLYREVEHAGGAAEMKITVKDAWNDPDVAGELSVHSGEIKVKDIPQRFTALNGKIAFSQGRVVVDTLSGEMGGGTLNMSGWAQLDGVALQDFSAKAVADNVTVRYPEGLISTLSGDLYYDGDASEQSLSGDVLIKRARYDKRIEWKTMLVDISRGLYQKRKTDVGWIGDTRINVRFHGADNILFQNNLAVMPLEVDVFLRGTVNHPQLLGRIEARKGSVYFRKNDFKILHASADFTDPNRMNPVLDIQAETRVREYQIRLAVTGTAERAVVTLISEPSLIDTDILGLLALGKKGSELKGKESGVGMGEAASFATGQFQDIFERRARSLTGLDRFQVDPYVGKSDTSVPRVTVGKELVQNKLFVTYSSNVGAATPEQIFRIEYLLNRHFSLVGERNEMGNTGADIKYRFEFK